MTLDYTMLAPNLTSSMGQSNPTVASCHKVDFGMQLYLKDVYSSNAMTLGPSDAERMIAVHISLVVRLQ